MVKYGVSEKIVEKRRERMYELTSNLVNILFFVVAGIAIATAIIKKKKK